MLYVMGLENRALFGKIIKPVIDKYEVEYKVLDEWESLIPDMNLDEGEDTLLCLGSKCLNKLKSEDLFHKGRAISSLRNQVHEKGTTNIVISYEPGLVDMDYSQKPNIMWDAELACRVEKYGNINIKLGDYKKVEDFSKIINYINEKFEKTGKPVPVAADTETMGLNPKLKGKHIICMSVTVKAGMSHIVFFKQGEPLSDLLREQITFLLNSDKISLRGANFKYDLHWIWEEWKIECTNFKLDTLLVGSILDENRSNSADSHAKIYLKDLGGYADEFNTKYDKGKMELIPEEELIPYAGGDSDSCYQVSEVVKGLLLQDRRLCKFYTKLLHPASRAFEQIERTGVLVDVKKYAELQMFLLKFKDRHEKSIFRIIPKELQQKYADNPSPVRPILLKDYFFTRAGVNLKPKEFINSAFFKIPLNSPNYEAECKAHAEEAKRLGIKNLPRNHGFVEAAMKDPFKFAATRIGHFKLFKDNKKVSRLVKLISSYKLAEKTQSTYVEGFMKFLNPETSRFYPTYMLYKGASEGDDDKGEGGGTKTGRTSLKDPALQQLPKHTLFTKKLRKCFIAPKGYKILNVDFSEGELRIIADVSGDPEMIKAYNNGISLHAITAAELSKLPLKEYMALENKDKSEYDRIRRNAKVINFGFPYGLGGPGFQNYAFQLFELVLSKKQSYEYQDLFFNKYKKVRPWHNQVITHARNKGYVVSPLGRIRHLPLIHSKNWSIRSKTERQAINSIVQSTLSDMLLLTVAEIDRLYRGEVFPFLMIHDSLALYVKEDEAVEWAKKITNIMENLPLHNKFGWLPKIPIVADAEIGPNLGELEKIKL